MHRQQAGQRGPPQKTTTGPVAPLTVRGCLELEVAQVGHDDGVHQVGLLPRPQHQLQPRGGSCGGPSRSSALRPRPRPRGAPHRERSSVSHGMPEVGH